MRVAEPLFLTIDEMVDLTGKHKRNSQVAALRSMSIEHKVRADGRVMVLRKHVEQIFGVVTQKGETEEFIANWDAA
ncbi:hypothetical protein BZM27_39650 [Paraburkholderia steynii]|uniref:DUF4224 domain-containing protein n=1 Tax=Paraburkholderia steynii TaxID=1245441 RepID=A0A4R0XC95_9BURK|nr:hypothetical protein BZM27_39650 [Paraburkholderia steynii]